MHACACVYFELHSLVALVPIFVKVSDRKKINEIQIIIVQCKGII